MAGVVVLVLAVAAALAFGLYRARVDGRFAKRTRGVDPELELSTPVAWLTAAIPGLRLGERATLVQFSSAFCAPCRATRRILAEVAEVVPGVVHVEIDAETHRDLVRQLAVQRTPTTLILDATGREITRAAGAPRKEQVLAALAATGLG